MNRALIASTGLHCVGVVFVLLAPTSRGPRWHPPDTIAVDLVASAPRQAPPAAVVQPPAPEPEVTAVEPEPEPPKEVAEKPAPKKPEVKPPAPRTVRRDAPRRPPPDEPSLEERIRRRLADVPGAPPSSESSPAPAAPSGGASGSRADVQAIDFPYAWYLNVLRTRITDAWDPPGESLVAGRTNQVTIAFRVYRDGRVSDITVSGASGTPGLDASARRAVERALPFPPLPDAYPGESLDVAVRFTVGGAS